MNICCIPWEQNPIISRVIYTHTHLPREDKHLLLQMSDFFSCTQASSSVAMPHNFLCLLQIHSLSFFTRPLPLPHQGCPVSITSMVSNSPAFLLWSFLRLGMFDHRKSLVFSRQPVVVHSPLLLSSNNFLPSSFSVYGGGWLAANSPRFLIIFCGFNTCTFAPLGKISLEIKPLHVILFQVCHLFLCFQCFIIIIIITTTAFLGEYEHVR